MEPSQSELEAIRRILADLTIRIDRIERRLRIDAEPAPPAAEHVDTAALDSPAGQSPSSIPTHASPPPPMPPRPAIRTMLQPKADLESRIGSHWLNRIGIFTVLVGVSYFLKYSFDSKWIGPSGLVTIGIIAGIAIVLWSERFRRKGYKAFSYSLKAVGIGTLYLSLWAAFHIYNLIPSGVAFGMMLLVTASAAAMALAQDAEILAAFALIGGFSTPLLLSTARIASLRCSPMWPCSMSPRSSWSHLSRGADCS